MPATDSIYFDVGQSIQATSGIWYRCVQWLGTGGNAVTYLVSANAGPHRGVLFALKVFRKLSDANRRTAFLKEVDFLKKCDHPCVMRVFDTGLFTTHPGGETLEFPFVIAEYLPTTLADVIRARSATIPERVSYVLQLLSALTYLGKLTPAVVHRDIKPQNIFVKGHSCVLGDFGLMKLLDAEIELGKAIFKDSGGAGMPFYYRTPDLVAYAKNESPLTTRTDVFQLGIVLCELLTGKNPCKPSADMLAPVVLDPVSHVPGSLGAGIAGLLKRMLIMDPQLRPEAEQLMDGWSGVFKDAVQQAHNLEGKVF